MSKFIKSSQYEKRVHLKPIWEGDIVYDELVTFIGETSSATLLFNPTEVLCVRDFHFEEEYTENVDFKIEGNKIIRLKGSKIPYWEVDDFYRTVYDEKVILRLTEKSDHKFNEQRYLNFGEDSRFVDKQIAVSYKCKKGKDVFIPEDQSKIASNLIKKLKTQDEINYMVYGDSVATGCNTSGSRFLNDFAPHTPIYPLIIKEYIESKFNVKLNYDNQAVGGWFAKKCLDNWDEKIKGKKYDLMVFRIGANDSSTDPKLWKEYMTEMVNRIFTDNPDCVLVLQSAEKPNPESDWVVNHDLWEGIMKEIASEQKGKNIIVAPCYSMYEWALSRGKFMRDMLANNVNHPNDFGVRLHAQTVLKVLLGKYFKVK
ncbi:MAG: SGNH/GDSL hydrolase family protein [Clostridia bacterium]|nr:SGNH/GDSL hydrolase family protein [Clostridia bacterium]